MECLKYENERKRFFDKVKEIIGVKWEEISLKEDRGLSYILGFGENEPGEVMYQTKRYLENVWMVRKRSQDNE